MGGHYPGGSDPSRSPPRWRAWVASRPTTPTRMSSPGHTQPAASPEPWSSRPSRATPAKKTPAISERTSRSCRGTAHLQLPEADLGVDPQPTGAFGPRTLHPPLDPDAVPFPPEAEEVAGAHVGVHLDRGARGPDDQDGA